MKFKLTLLLLFCFNVMAFGQDNSDNLSDKESNWEFDVTPYLWFASLKGDVSFLNQTVPTNIEFKDILDQLSIGAFVHLETHKGPWTIMTDLMYLKLKEDGKIGNTSVTTKMETDQTIWELGGGYRIIKLQDYLKIDALLGMRYFGLKPSIDINGQNVLDKSINFVDPYIGIRFKNTNDKWINSARFDIGGFGVGSEFSWKFDLLLGYQFSDRSSMYLGYQAYDVDYEADNSFVYDVFTGGIITGFNFHF